MIEKISNDLNKKMNKENTIYVLKGFNCISKKLNINFDHIFDLKIDDDLVNISNVDMLSLINDCTSKLATGDSYYCFMEELLFIEKNNLFGLIQSGNKYNIDVIDIGCFNYYYPGLICNSIEKCISKFDSDEPNQNIYQKIYAEFTTSNGVPIINYNKLENEDSCSFYNLYNMYGTDYVNNNEHTKEIELLDNAPSERLVEIFFDALYGNVNKIIYTSVENKKI